MHVIFFVETNWERTPNKELNQEDSEPDGHNGDNCVDVPLPKSRILIRPLEICRNVEHEYNR